MVDNASLRLVLVHTGQHYDDNLSANLLAELGLPAPHVNLHIGSRPRREQIERTEQAFARTCVLEHPDLVVVVGDANSTVACARAASSVGVPVAHVEAGLRSFEPDLPEESNRIETDRLASLLFAPSADAAANLVREGHQREKIHHVGNVMVDSLHAVAERAQRSAILSRLSLSDGGYGVATLHRASNVDDRAILQALVAAIQDVGVDCPMVFAMHPRTRARLMSERLTFRQPQVQVCNPLGYVDFVRLLRGARVVLTDSGGVQEESTALGVRCLTLRTRTERPVTVKLGTNRVVGTDPRKIVRAARIALGAPVAPRTGPPTWDGKASRRVAAVIERFVGVRRPGLSEDEQP